MKNIVVNRLLEIPDASLNAKEILVDFEDGKIYIVDKDNYLYITEFTEEEIAKEIEKVSNDVVIAE